MRIVCPACDATYDVPDAMLAGGARVVRCARCGHEWVPAGAAPPPTTFAPLPPPEHEEQDEPFAPPPEPDDLPPAPTVDPMGRQEPRLRPLRSRTEARPAELPPPEPSRRGTAGAMVAWALSLLLLAGLGAAAVAWRGKVMTAWPPSERVYAALGLG